MVYFASSLHKLTVLTVQPRVCALTVLVSLFLLCEQTHGPLSDRQADRLLAVIARGSVIPSASGLLLFPCKRQIGGGGGQLAERPDPNLSLHKALHDGDVAQGANNLIIQIT